MRQRGYSEQTINLTIQNLANLSRRINLENPSEVFNHINSDLCRPNRRGGLYWAYRIYAQKHDIYIANYKVKDTKEKVEI
ncbi:MAG: hypothetical protein ABIH76_04585 [Candidatus Bathyarchaeota archaeon]